MHHPKAVASYAELSLLLLLLLPLQHGKIGFTLGQYAANTAKTGPMLGQRVMLTTVEWGDFGSLLTLMWLIFISLMVSILWKLLSWAKVTP